MRNTSAQRRQNLLPSRIGFQRLEIQTAKPKRVHARLRRVETRRRGHASHSRRNEGGLDKRSRNQSLQRRQASAEPRKKGVACVPHSRRQNGGGQRARKSRLEMPYARSPQRRGLRQHHEAHFSARQHEARSRRLALDFRIFGRRARQPRHGQIQPLLLRRNFPLRRLRQKLQTGCPHGVSRRRRGISLRYGRIQRQRFRVHARRLDCLVHAHAVVQLHGLGVVADVRFALDRRRQNLVEARKIRERRRAATPRKTRMRNDAPLLRAAGDIHSGERKRLWHKVDKAACRNDARRPQRSGERKAENKDFHQLGGLVQQSRNNPDSKKQSTAFLQRFLCREVIVEK